MADLVIPLLAFGVVLALLALVIALFILRRYLLARDIRSFDCALRREPGHTAGGWMFGVARYQQDRLDWYRIFAASPRPGRSFARSRLLILERRAPIGAEGYTVSPGSVIVLCSYGALKVEFAMSELASNGFATWLESAPPGEYSIMA